MTTTYAVGQRLTASLLQALADSTVNKPIVRLIATSTQSLTDNTSTAIAFGAGSTIIDTHGYHDEVTNNTRVTPTKAGYYRAWGIVAYGSRTDYATLQSVIRFNGTDQVGNHRLGPNATSTPRGASAGPIIVLCNGTTDYIELGGLQDNVANAAQATTSSGSTNSYLEVEFVRPA
jgi:hypothetical protein